MTFHLQRVIINLLKIIKMKLNWTKIATSAGAVVLGVIIHKLVVKALGMSSATETMFGASGQPMGGTCVSSDPAICNDACENTMKGTYNYDDKRCYYNGVAVNSYPFVGGKTTLASRRLSR